MKTKAELTAEREAFDAARLEEMVRAYPQRLMAVLERATKENFELTVREGQFRVEDRDGGYGRRGEAYMLTLEFSKSGDSTLDRLEWDVEEKEAARREAERKANLRATALAKLTAEERETLGL